MVPFTTYTDTKYVYKTKFSFLEIAHTIFLLYSENTIQTCDLHTEDIFPQANEDPTTRNNYAQQLLSRRPE